jgi:hypothetical protein
LPVVVECHFSNPLHLPWFPYTLVTVLHSLWLYRFLSSGTSPQAHRTKKVVKSNTAMNMRFILKSRFDTSTSLHQASSSFIRELSRFSRDSYGTTVTEYTTKNPWLCPLSNITIIYTDDDNISLPSGWSRISFRRSIGLLRFLFRDHAEPWNFASPIRNCYFGFSERNHGFYDSLHYTYPSMSSLLGSPSSNFWSPEYDHVVLE